MDQNAGIVACYACGESFPSMFMHVHHKTPRAAGGKDNDSNIVHLCPMCHNAVHLITRHYVKGAVALAKDSATLLTKGNAKWTERLMELVQVESRSWREGDVADDQLITIKLPRNIYNQLKQIAKVKKRKGQGGVGSLLRSIVLGWLSVYLKTGKW